MGTLPALLTNPDVLLIGGGKIALQKAQSLHKNNIRFAIIAQSICAELHQSDFQITEKEISSDDLTQADVIVDATGNPSVAKMVLDEKSKRHFLFNCVSQPKLGNVYFPAILNIGDLKIAVTTDGASPTVSRVVRDKIASFIPREIASLLTEKKEERAKGIRNVKETEEQSLALFSTVYLIGCGPGDADLMTLKATKHYSRLTLFSMTTCSHRKFST